MKRLIKYLAFIILIPMGSCQLTTDAEAPDEEFFLSREWRIQKVIVNGSEVTDVDLSQYLLRLNSDGTFFRRGIEGNDENGNWGLNSNVTQMILFVGEINEERYFIIDLQIRTLELQLIQDSDKTGSLEIRYILEAIRE